MSCITCFHWKDKRNFKELTEEQWIAFLNELKAMVKTNIEVRFTGGESLLKEGILDILAESKRLGFYTTMTTNGYLLDKAILEKLAALKLDNISISLNSLDPAKHDYFKGREGSLNKIFEAMKIIRELKLSLPINICTIISGLNLEDILPIILWVKKNEDVLRDISFQAITQPFRTYPEPDWFEKEKYSYLWPKEHNKVVKLIDQIIEMRIAGYPIGNSYAALESYKNYFEDPRKKVKQNCNFNFNVIHLGPFGDVNLCTQMNGIGKIIVNPLKKLLSTNYSAICKKTYFECPANCEILVNQSFKQDT